MGGGRLVVLVVSFIVGATSNILPFHRSDMFEISVDEEYDTIAERNTELLELDGFEIFGGFGYSNSLSDFGVPVVYKDVVNLQVIDEETLINFDEKILDMEKETIGELDIEKKYGNGIDDTSLYEEKVDQLEDEMIETVNNEVTDEEFKHESVLLEGNSYPPLDTGSKEDMIGDNLDEIEMPETEHNYIEETSAEYGDLQLDEESIIGEDEIHKPFPVNLGKTDNLVLDTSEGNMSENKDDIRISEREFENELGISGSKETNSFSSSIVEKTEDALEELMEEAKNMEINEELSVLQNMEEKTFAQSIACSKCFETDTFIFVFLFVNVMTKIMF